MAVPQLAQKRADGRLPWPQAGQATASLVPHWMQKLAPGSLVVPQLPQITCAKPYNAPFPRKFPLNGTNDEERRSKARWRPISAGFVTGIPAGREFATGWEAFLFVAPV
jgi:hypothetical protein